MKMCFAKTIIELEIFIPIEPVHLSVVPEHCFAIFIWRINYFKMCLQITAYFLLKEMYKNVNIVSWFEK